MYKYEAISNQMFESEKEKEFRLAREREAQVVQQYNASVPGAFMEAMTDNWVRAIRNLCRFFVKVDLELRWRANKRLSDADAEAVFQKIRDLVGSESQSLKMTLVSKFKARGLDDARIQAFLPTLNPKTDELIREARNDVSARMTSYHDLH